MISDSITNASRTAASTNARDFSKKKKKKMNNKGDKMNQNKLGLRCDQWLSQVAVTNKEEEPDHRDNNGGNLHHESCFMESPSSSSVGGTNFSERSRSSISSSSSSSVNITEEDNDDDGCVDDWEAFADALEAEEEEEKEKLLHESAKEQENVAQSATSVGGSISDASSAEQDCLRMPSSSKRAWRPDDGHRPHVLPKLDKRFITASTPSSCPICCEDLDATDSSFFPCPCGFRLCLFCHNTIYDGDGRCPGCRKSYERDAITTETSFEGGCVTLRLTRSSSMFCRS